MGIWIGRITSGIVVAAGWLLFGARLVLDLVGYATFPEDTTVALGRVGDVLDWLSSIPWWALLGFALISSLWLMWVSWPRSSGADEQRPAKASRYPSVAANMRYAKGRFGTVDRAMKVGELSERDLRDFDDARHKFRATEVSLRSLGFKTPWCHFETDPLAYIKINIGYIEQVEPLIAARQIKAAKRMASHIVSTIDPSIIDKTRL